MGNGFPWLPGRQLWIKKYQGLKKMEISDRINRIRSNPVYPVKRFD